MAKRIVDLGDNYDWGTSVRVHSADTLVRRLTDQWKRHDRGERLLAEERTRRLDQQKHSKQEERLAIQKYLADSTAAIEMATKSQAEIATALGRQHVYLSEKSLSEAQLATVKLVAGAITPSVSFANNLLQISEVDDLRHGLEKLHKKDD